MKFKHFFLCIIAIVLLASCASSRTSVQLNHRATLSTQEKFEFDAIYFEAVNQQLSGNYASAYELLNKALEIDSTAAEAHLCMAEVLEEVRTPRDTAKLQLIHKHLRLATHYAPNNPTYFEKYSNVLLERGNYEEALPYLEKLAKLSTSSALYYDLAKTYAQLLRYEEAHHALNHVANMEGEIYPVIEMRAKLYDAAGDTATLFSYLKKTCIESPEDISVIKLHLDYSINYNNVSFIKDELLERLEKNPENPEYQIGLFFIYSLTPQDNEILMWDILERIVCNSLIEEEERAKFVNLVADHLTKNRKDFAPLFKIYDTAIYTDLKSSALPLHYSYLLNKQKEPAERILPVLLRAKEIEPENEDNYNSLVALYREMNETGEVIKICQEAQRCIPGTLYFYFSEAYHRYDELRAADIIEILERGLRYNSNNDDELLPTIHNWLGDKYFEIGKKQLAYEHYEKALAIDKYDVGALNNYAYYLSLEEERLDYAEELGQRLLEVEPNNPTYLDTYAWILYKQKKTVEAKTYIDKTLEAADKEDYDSAVLFDHAGDIYLANGESQTACLHWIKALELTIDPDERKAIHNKIKRYALPPISVPKL